MSKAAQLFLSFALGCAVGFGVSTAWTPAEPAGEPGAAIAVDQVGARAREILTGDDPLRRLTELSVLLSALGAEAVPALTETFDAAPLDGGDPEFVLLATWWSRFDPQAAYEWTSSDWRAQFGSVIAAVFRGWGHSDPQRALEQAQTVRFPVQRQLAMDAALAGWDESGRPGLMGVLEGLSSPDQQRIGEILARRRVVSLGPEGAIRWVESLEYPALQEMMAVRVAGAAAGVKHGAPFVAKWAEPRISSSTDRPSGYPRRIGTRWITHDPEGAMAWLATLPDGGDRDDGVAESYRDWMRRDPPAAFAWIEKTGVRRWNEPAVAVYARTQIHDRPKETLELVSRFSDAALRESTTVVVARAWAENDRAAAQAWLDQSGLPEDVRRRAAAVGTTPRRERMKVQAKAQAEGQAETTAEPND